jgi:hypothetical protein
LHAHGAILTHCLDGGLASRLELASDGADQNLSLPRIVADAIDGGAGWLTNQRTRKYRRP